MPYEQKLSETEYILREASSRFENPALSWAGGKDSTTIMHITKNLFPEFPFRVVFLDTMRQFTETYQFIDEVSRAWDIPVTKAKNYEALNDGIGPDSVSKVKCCNKLKTENLKKAIEDYGIDCYITGIRWDEHDVRGKDYHWSEREDPDHIRCHPLANWTEEEVWEYILDNDVPVNPIYEKGYRSVGCYPCSEPVTEKSIPDVKKEASGSVSLPGVGERAGRAQDKEKVMERLRKMGYL